MLSQNRVGRVLLLSISILASSVGLSGQIAVTTHHNDLNRTGVSPSGAAAVE